MNLKYRTLVLSVLLTAVVNTGLFSGSEMITTTEEFFAHRIDTLMKKNRVPGAVLSIVKDGKIVVNRGFGYADVAARVPVDPERTLFRVGSISKLFVWTALMQLYEKGALDLDADINTYLGEYRVPDKFGAPITVRHLMSHTPGFTDNVLGLFTKDGKKLGTLADVVRDRRPERIVPPGKQIAYSNYGATLGGYIVERVSNMPFEEYVEKNIFAPLGMTHSTFRQPVPGAFASDCAKGYVYTGKGYTEQGFEYVQDAPAGAMSATAVDIARFLVAHLDEEGAEGAKILRPDIMRLMHERHFSYGPRVNGFAHGFIEVDMNGRRIIGHGGDTIYFHSIAFILPSEGLGIFISTNGAEGATITIPVFIEFVNLFFPAPAGDGLVDAAAVAATDSSKYIGSYRVNRRDEYDFLKLMSLMMTTYVSRSADGAAIDLYDIMRRTTVRCVEIEPGILQDEKGTFRYAFTGGESGPYTGLIYNHFPVFTFLRAPVHEQAPFNGFIVLAALILIVIGFVAKPTGLIAFVSGKNKPTGLARIAGYIGTLLIMSYIVFIVSFCAMLCGDFLFSVPGPGQFAGLYAALVITAIMCVLSVVSWLKEFWSVRARVYYSLLTLGSVGLIWFAVYWKLIF